MTNIIFDLDLTLVNTSNLEVYRRSKSWELVYTNIWQCSLYSGFKDVFQFIREKSIKTCIVSSAPRPYVVRIVNYFDIPCDYIVAYHDTIDIKPSPMPMLKALELLNCKSDDVISFGDNLIDIRSSKAANIKAVACTWGAKSLSSLINSQYDFIINNPSEILDILRQ